MSVENHSSEKVIDVLRCIFDSRSGLQELDRGFFVDACDVLFLASPYGRSVAGRLKRDGWVVFCRFDRTIFLGV